jgi:WG containing repeat
MSIPPAGAWSSPGTRSPVSFGKSAIIDLEGRQVLEPKFARAHPFTKDVFWVLEGTRRFDGQPGMAELVSHRDFNVTHDIAAAGKWGLVDRTGAWIRPLEFTAIMAVRTGSDIQDDSLTWARVGGGWGLIKPDGTWLAEPKFEAVGSALGERTPVRLEGRWGYIDRTGTIVIAPQFEAAGTFAPNGLAPVKLGRRWGYVDQAGTIVIQPRFDVAYGFERDGLARAKIGNLAGLIDRTGAWVIEPEYDTIYHGAAHHHGMAWVETGKQWGAFDRSGRLIVAPQFSQTAGICDDGWVIGYADGKSHVARREGAAMSTIPQGELSGSDCQGPFRIRLGDRFGYVDRMLQPITDRKFEAAFMFSEGAAAVKLDGRFGYIKPDGAWLIEPRFDEAEPFFGGLAVVKTGGKFGYVKPDGTWQIEPRFEVARRFRDGFAIVRVDGKNGMIDATGEWLVEPRWRVLGLALDSGLAAARTDEKWGFIDAGGAQVIGGQYDEFSYFQRGVAWVKSGGTWCAIDRRGRSVPTLECQNADPKPKPGTSTMRTR